MLDTFYKAGRAMAADKGLSYGEKWVRVIQAHYLAFEGREPTSAEIARALGRKGRRGINKILARLARREQKALVGGNKRPARAGTKGPKTGTKGPPSHSLLDIETKERGMTAPSSPATQGGKKETAGTGALALLHLKARAGGGKWRFEQWAGQVEEDTAARRYFRADLEAFVASRTSITEAPWKLAEAVRRHAQAAKQAAFRERLRTIRAEGLTAVRWKGEGEPPNNLPKRGRVKYPDPDAGLLVLAFDLPMGPGRTFEKYHEIRRPEDLRGWRFRAEQPVLAFMERTSADDADGRR